MTAGARACAQVMLAALEKGVSRRRAQEAATGAYGEAQRGMGGLSEAEKAFTSQVLAAGQPPHSFAESGVLRVLYLIPPSSPLHARGRYLGICCSAVSSMQAGCD